MPTIIEPIGAGILVALINKFVINNHSLWQHVCGCGHHPPPPENIHEDASSSTTSINDVEVHMHHSY